ncbi:hypothetical protein [Thermococcus sp.]
MSVTERKFLSIILLSMLFFNFPSVSSLTIQEYRSKTFQTALALTPEPESKYPVGYYNLSLGAYVEYLSVSIIALHRSGYNGSLEELASRLKALQAEDGSFPAIVTNDGPFEDASDLSVLFFEFSKPAGTALAALALIEAGEPLDSPQVTKAVGYLEKSKKHDHWESSVFRYHQEYSTAFEYIGNFSSVVATAYATTLFRLVGKNVTDEWHWLNETLLMLKKEKNVIPFTTYDLLWSWRNSIILPLLYLNDFNISLPVHFEASRWANWGIIDLEFRLYCQVPENYTLLINGMNYSGTCAGQCELMVPVETRGEDIVADFSPSCIGSFYRWELPADDAGGFGDRVLKSGNNTMDVLVYPGSNLDGSFFHGVYSTSIGLLWWYYTSGSLARAKPAVDYILKADGNATLLPYRLTYGIPKGRQVWEFPYALIALSVENGEWQKQSLTPIPLYENASGGGSRSPPIGLLVLSLVLIAVVAATVFRIRR